ncbi:MAG TPA: hypothetical protein DEO36_01995 [Flavobacteriaceae bacterium]|jgi:hypothetical protein|nr:hypothetical protein [Flavobacteriaceae bacterium]
MKLFKRNKIKFEIQIPVGIEQEWFQNKVRFVGEKEKIYKLSREFIRLKELKSGDKVKLGKLTLKVSDYITSDRKKTNWIELPNHAWGIMSSKFYDVWEGYDDNPFDFNDCGYIDKIPFDIGIEITDLPLTDELLFELPHIKFFKSEWKELYLIVEDTELADYIDDELTENDNIEIISHISSEINGKSRYRLYIKNEQEKTTMKCLKKMNEDEIERIWKLNNE